MTKNITAEKVAGLWIGLVDGKKVTALYKTKGLAIAKAEKVAATEAPKDAFQVAIETAEANGATETAKWLRLAAQAR